MTWSACETVTWDQQHTKQSRKRALTLRRRVLDGDGDDLAVVNDDSRSLESGSTQKGLSIKDKSDGGTESSLVITDWVVRIGSQLHVNALTYQT